MLLRFPNSVGIDPDTWLPFSKRMAVKTIWWESNKRSAQRQGQRSVASVQPNKANSPSFVNRPTSIGIVPVSPTLWRNKEPKPYTTRRHSEWKVESGQTTSCDNNQEYKAGRQQPTALFTHEEKIQDSRSHSEYYPPSTPQLSKIMLQHEARHKHESCERDPTSHNVWWIQDRTFVLTELSKESNFRWNTTKHILIADLELLYT